MKCQWVSQDSSWYINYAVVSNEKEKCFPIFRTKCRKNFSFRLKFWQLIFNMGCQDSGKLSKITAMLRAAVVKWCYPLHVCSPWGVLSVYVILMKNQRVPMANLWIKYFKNESWWSTCNWSIINLSLLKHGSYYARSLSQSQGLFVWQLLLHTYY